MSTVTGSRITAVGTTLENFTRLFSFGAFGTANNRLNGPTAVAVDPPYLWIADHGNRRILKWKLQGAEYVAQIEDVRSYAIEIVENKLYVMDTYNDKIHIYDKDTLELLKSSAEFSNVSGMAWFLNTLVVVDDTDKAVYQLDPNSLEIVKTLQISGVSDAYEDIASLGQYLFLLTDAGMVYRITRDLEYDNYSLDLSSYLSEPYYINAHGDYLFVSGLDENIVVISGGLVVVEDVTFDTDDWSSAYDIKTLSENTFLAADYSANRVVCMFGYSPEAGKASGDVVGFDDLTFGDGVIGADEENMPT